MRVLATTEEKVSLDVIDKKLIWLLAVNARFSYSTLAKHVNLSREAVKQRIKKLMEKKVILGFQTAINSQLLGFPSYHLFLKLKNVQKKNEEELIKEILIDPDVNALLRYEGNFDLEIAYQLDKINKLDAKLKKLSSAEIKDCVFYALLENIVSNTYPECLHHLEVNLKKVRHDGSFHGEFGRAKTKLAKLDETDYRLLGLLSNEARVSITNLSAKLNLSIDSVSYRIKKLIAAKVILRFQPILNYAALGFSVYCVFFKLKNVPLDKENKFNYFFKTHKNVLWSTTCLGPSNNITYLIVKDTFEYHQVIQEIKDIFFEIIEAYDSLLAFAEYKYTTFSNGITKSNEFSRAEK